MKLNKFRYPQTDAVQDEEIINLSKKLLAALEETEQGREALGKYNIHAENSEIGNIGDNANIKGGIHFGKSNS